MRQQRVACKRINRLSPRPINPQQPTAAGPMIDKERPMSKSELELAIIGMGNVGTGVARILTHHPQRITQRAGRPIRIRHAVVKDPQKPRDIVLPDGVLTTNLDRVIHDPQVEIAVELIGGLHPAREVVLALLAAGKHVVTANKALLCEHGDELFDAARKAGKSIAFEAAVAGGIPIIAAVGQSMAGNQILGIQAILNGTSNYILSEMLLKGASYGSALRGAQQLGYAEADPSLDVNGTDAAQKLGILAQLAYGTKLPTSAFRVEGIDRLEQSDIRYATQLGYTIKLLATAKLVDGQLQMSVRPTLIHKDRPLAQIHGPFNAILLDGDVVGTVWYSGRGAGQLPTASAVTADIIDLAIGRAQLTFERLDLWGESPAVPALPEARGVSRYYLRLEVADRPHVMADITDILGREGISLASVIQPEAREVEAGSPTPTVDLIIMTHRTTGGQLAAAKTRLQGLPSVSKPLVVLAVAD
jgi:homoserine dehydrogenase